MPGCRQSKYSNSPLCWRLPPLPLPALRLVFRPIIPHTQSLQEGLQKLRGAATVDGKYCPAFQQTIDAAGVTRVPLPPRSPNLNAYAERWVRSVKEECLSRLILFGEASLRHALTQYVPHFHHERNHQGKGNVLLFPTISQDTERQGPVQCRERLGGLLKYYDRAAA